MQTFAKYSQDLHEMSENVIQRVCVRYSNADISCDACKQCVTYRYVIGNKGERGKQGGKER